MQRQLVPIALAVAGWLLPGLAGLVVVSSPLRAQAWCRLTTARGAAAPGECNNEGLPLEWRRRCMSYAIHRRGSAHLAMEDVQNIVAASFGSWLAVDCNGQNPGFDVREIANFSSCQYAEYNPDGGNVNAILFVNDWERRDYDPDAYAVTTVWHNTHSGEIFDGDVELNQSTRPFGVCPAEAGCTDMFTVDLQNVLTHEIGHFFGLGHTAEATATMFARSPAGEVRKRVLRTDDIEGFCTVYPPGLLPTSCDFSPKGGLLLTCASADDCNCAAPGLPGGRSHPLAALVALAALLAISRRRKR